MNREKIILGEVMGLVLILIVVLAAYAYHITKEFNTLQAEVKLQQQQLELAAAEYRKQLAVSAQLRIERDKAKEAINYKKETPIQYQANLIGDFIQFLGESKDMSNQAKKLNADSPEDLEKYAENLQKTLDKGIGILGRIIIRNTEEPEQEPKK
jgi:hypothetical protein